MVVLIFITPLFYEDLINHYIKLVPLANDLFSSQTGEKGSAGQPYVFLKSIYFMIDHQVLFVQDTISYLSGFLLL